MELEIIIMPDGSVAIAADEQEGYSFEEARHRMETFQQAAGLAGVPIRWTGEIERHTHGPDGQRVRRHQYE